MEVTMVSRMCVLYYALALSVAAMLPAILRAAVPFSPGMKTFSHAIKNGKMKGHNTENIVFEYKSGPGVITEQWTAGAGCMDSDTTFRMYIDGETSASLEFNLYMAHAIGVTEDMEKTQEIWGTHRFGHTANNGGLYNTYRIPFGSSIKITVSQSKADCTFWYIVRGMENLPVVLGDIILPSSARLRLYKNENLLLNPSQYYTVAEVTGKAGAVLQHTIRANSSDFNFLEACYRVRLDGSDYMLLSSGTEDFFLSAYYFNQGTFHLPNSGLTYVQKPNLMVAYKFFENDPIVFTKSFNLTSRCGDLNSCLDMPSKYHQQQQQQEQLGTCKVTAEGKRMCYPGRVSNPRNASTSNVQLAKTLITTYTWVYEWDSP